jgi:hypothetical protein
VQHGIAEWNADIDPDRSLGFRIGINICDVMIDDEKSFFSPMARGFLVCFDLWHFSQRARISVADRASKGRAMCCRLSRRQAKQIGYDRS